MAHATPQVMGDRLIRPDRRDEVITLGTATWFDWLEQATTFAFVGVDGRYAAREERARRTGWCWTAYRMERGQLRRAYRSKSSELTLERLLAAADSLARQEPRTENQEPASASDSPGSQFSVGYPLGGSQLLATKLTIPP